MLKMGLKAIAAGAFMVVTAAPVFSQGQGMLPMQTERTPLDNAYVTVTRDAAPCAKAEPRRCEDRVILAMTDIEVTTGIAKRALKRGEVAVFRSGESYEPPVGGPYFEIAIKPDHPPVKSTDEQIPPPKNVIVHQNETFFVYEEKLAVGDTRPRHTHSQRVEIRLSNGPMLHQWVWQDGAVKESEPSRVNWREPMIHEVRNIGDAPLSNFILEFMPPGK